MKRWHPILGINNYKIIGKEYKNNTRKRKIAEELVIKEMKPIINKKRYFSRMKTVQLMIALTLEDSTINTSVQI